MEDCITIQHELSCFSVTSEPELVKQRQGRISMSREESSTAQRPERCPICGSAMYRHGKQEMKVQDSNVSLMHTMKATADVSSRYRNQDSLLYSIALKLNQGQMTR